MNSLCDPATQQTVIHALSVTPHFDVQAEIAHRVDFLASQLRQNGLRSLVLGISGGVDSLAAGLLAQKAVEKLRADGYDAIFIAMRLPYGVQHDEDDAAHCLQVIQPDRIITTDIQPATDQLLAQLLAGGLTFDTPTQQDFVVGNIKARQRMVAQYAVAGAMQGLVIGSDQAAEALMGFFTKFGDGACDVTPLTGLNKRRVRALTQALGAPDFLVYKVPTADLESLTPMRPDEAAFGVTYQEIDDFLEGKTLDDMACAAISRHYHGSAHKRALPIAPAPLETASATALEEHQPGRNDQSR